MINHTEKIKEIKKQIGIKPKKPMRLDYLVFDNKINNTMLELAKNSTKQFILNSELRIIYTEVYLWLTQNPKGALKQEKGFLFCGDCGNGKTLLLNIIKDIFLLKSTIANLYNCYDIIEMYRKQELDKISILKKKKIIMLDDLGVEQVEINIFGSKIEPINEIIQSAYENNSLLFISTNLTEKGILKKYGERTHDRLKEMCNHIVFTSESFRK